MMGLCGELFLLLLRKWLDYGSQVCAWEASILLNSSIICLLIISSAVDDSIKAQTPFISIKQKDNESLCEYISRFNATILKISDLDQMIAMMAMKNGLRPSRFFFNLEKRFFTDYAEMLAQAKKYANAEEAMAAQKETTSR